MIGSITVIGTERTTPTAILSSTDLHDGSQWTPQTAEKARHAILHQPLIQSVQFETGVRTHGAVALQVHVAERHAIGIVKLPDGGLTWVDGEGYLLGSVQVDPALPIIEGLSAGSTDGGHRVTPAAAIPMIRAFYSLDGRTLSQFSSLTYRDYDLVLTARNGWTALLPPQDLKLHVEQLQQVISTLKQSKDPSWRTIDLRFSGEVVIGR